jgi:hypothetical protein
VKTEDSGYYHEPGYRVHFGNDGDEAVLLGGGDKTSQTADIEKAKDRWKDYNAEASNGLSEDVAGEP